MAIYLYNSPEYLQTTFAAVKVGPRPGQHQLPLRRRRAELPVGERRRHRRRVPRGVRRPHRGHPRSGARRARAGSGSTTARGPARTGPRRTRTRPSPPSRGSRAPWGRSGDDLYMLYTGGTTGMPKGVMWRQDDLFARLIDSARAPLPGRRRHRGGARPRSRPARAAPPSCRPARSCTGPATSPPTRCWPRAGGSACSSRASYDPVGAARHHRAREGQRRRLRGRPLRPPAAGRARRATRAGGT